MRFFPKAVRGTAAALAMAVAAIAAGCAGGTPAYGPASAHPVAATASMGAGTPRTVPPVFAASFAPAKAGSAGDRLALLSSRTGDLLRWLTPQPQGAIDGVMSVRDGWVYFVRYPIDLRPPLDTPSPAIWRMRVNSVLVFDAFTATTIRDGRTAPTPCTVAYNYQCEGLDPAYLASGALTYVIQRLSRSGAARASLVAWQAGRRTILLSFPAGMQTQFYDMTAQGQAIWVNGTARPNGPWMIWRWSGGAPVEIAALPPLGASPYYGVGAIAW